MNDLMGEAFNLLAAGMGFVFVFLTLLVFVTGLMSKIINRFFPEPVAQPAKPAAAPAPAGTDEQTLIAVISAAIKQYRARHHK